MSVPSGHHSNTHLCNIKVAEYQSSKRRGLFVCHGCKGRLVVELFNLVAPCDVARPEHVELSLNDLQDGSFLPRYEQALWGKCGLNFPGLKPLRRSWAKIVLHLAKELAPNIRLQDGGALSLVPTGQTVCSLDSEAAYRWWKAANVERAKSRQATAEAGRTAGGPSAPSTLAPTVILGSSHASENMSSLLSSTAKDLEITPKPPGIMDPIPKPLGLHALEASLYELLKQHDALQESETHAIECEGLKRRAEVDLLVATAELSPARQAGDQSEIQRLQRGRDEAVERARESLNAYQRASEEMLNKKIAFMEMENSVGDVVSWD